MQVKIRWHSGGSVVYNLFFATKGSNPTLSTSFLLLCLMIKKERGREIGIRREGNKVKVVSVGFLVACEVAGREFVFMWEL